MRRPERTGIATRLALGAATVAMSTVSVAAAASANTPTLPPEPSPTALATLPPHESRVGFDCVLDGRPVFEGLVVSFRQPLSDLVLSCDGLDPLLSVPAGIEWKGSPVDESGPPAIGVEAGEVCRYKSFGDHEVVVVDTTTSGLGKTLCEGLRPGLTLHPGLYGGWSPSSQSDARVQVNRDQVVIDLSTGSLAWVALPLDHHEGDFTIQAAVHLDAVPEVAGLGLWHTLTEMTTRRT